METGSWFWVLKACSGTQIVTINDFNII